MDAWKKYLPHLCILLGGASWGLIGLFSRQLLNGGLSPRNIVLVRNLGGLLLMAVIFLLFDRGAMKINWRHLPYFFGTGVISVLFFTLLYFSCQEQCSLAVAAVLLYSSPAFVVVSSAFFLKVAI